MGIKLLFYNNLKFNNNIEQKFPYLKGNIRELEIERFLRE